VIAAGIPPAALNVESMPFDQVKSNALLPAQGSAHYSVGFDASCGVANQLDVAPDLPAGFRIVPTGATLTIGGTSVPLAVSSATPRDPEFTFHLSPTASLTTAAAITASQCTGRQHFVLDFTADPTAELGTDLTSSVTVSAGSEAVTTAAGQAPVTIVDPTTLLAQKPTDSTLACGAPQVTPVAAGHAYTDRLSSPGNVDFFCLSNIPAGSGVIVTLSNLHEDLDVLAFGQGPASLRGKPFAPAPYGNRSALVTDTQLMPSSDGTTTPPELVDDIPMMPGLSIMDAGVHRKTTTESIYVSPSDLASGTLFFQVSGFNLPAGLSRLPYLLNVTELGSSAQTTCTAPTYPAAGVTPYAAGNLPSSPLAGGLTALPSDTNSLFLLDKKQLGLMYGTTRADAAVAAVTSLLNQGAGTDHAVKGQIVYVDAIDGVRAARATLATSPCDLAARQALVTAINKYIDSVRGGAMQLRFVTIVGGDQVIPYAMVPDRSALANESTFGPELALNGGDNPLSRAMSLGNLPTDNPYCDLAPVTFGGTPLYTPQLACGRLVESPEDIVAAIHSYEASDGVRTPTTGLAAGYDWMQRTADDNAAALTALGQATTTMPAGWDAVDDPGDSNSIINAIKAHAHGFISINAHSDPTASLSAADFASGTVTPTLFTPHELPADLADSVMFTIGCHLGLSVDDTYVANPALTGDWAQGVAGRNGLLAAAQTGYGLGDSNVQAYSARLLYMFAQQLDGSVSVGQALQLAKKRYMDLGVASVYDAKAIEEATYYGLPQYRLGTGGTWGAATLAAAAAPGGTSQATSSLTVTPQFNEVDTQDGSYYRVGQEPPLTAPREAAQPQTVIALTKPAAAGANATARDAVIESLSSKDQTGFNPVYVGLQTSGATAADEPAVSLSAFPSRLQSVVSNNLVLVPGQFLSDGSKFVSTQRLFSGVKTTVNWCDTTDHERPVIGSVDSWIDGGIAHFTVNTTATDVKRGVILFLAAGSTDYLPWTHVELVKDSLGRWAGTSTLPATNTPTHVGQYFVQLSDGCNVGVSSNKATNYDSSTTARSVQLLLSTPDRDTGLYPPYDYLSSLDGTTHSDLSTTSVTVVPSSAAGTVTWSLVNTSISGDVPITGSCTGTAGDSGCTTSITGDGKHILEVRDSNGVLLAEAAVPIDQHGPTLVFDPSTWAGDTFAQGQVVQTGFNPDTSCTGTMTVVVCNGPVTLDTSTSCTDPAHPCTATFTAVDEYGITTTRTVTYFVDATPPTVTGSGPSGTISQNTGLAFTFGATDPDDTAFTFYCELDNLALQACNDGTYNTGTTALADGTHTLTVVAMDRINSSALYTFTWRVDHTGPSFTGAGSTFAAVDGQGAAIAANGSTSTFSTSATVTFAASDATNPVTYAVVTDSTAVPSTFTSTSPATFSALAAGPHTITVWAKDGVGNLSSTSISWTVKAQVGTLLSTANAVQRTGTLPATLTDLDGHPLANKPLYFFVLNTDGTIQWLSCGVKAATNPPTPAYTNSQGVAGCAYTPSKPVANSKNYWVEFSQGNGVKRGPSTTVVSNPNPQWRVRANDPLNAIGTPFPYPGVADSAYQGSWLIGTFNS